MDLRGHLHAKEVCDAHDCLDAEDPGWPGLRLPAQERGPWRRQHGRPQPGHAVLHRGRNSAGPLDVLSAARLRRRRDQARRPGDPAATPTPDRLGPRPGYRREARAGLPGLPATGRAHRRTGGRAESEPHRQAAFRGGEANQGRGVGQAVQRGRRLRLHVQCPQVGLGAVGRGRCGHAGADRQRPPPGGCRGARLHGAGGRRDQEGRCRRGRCGDAGRRHWGRSHGVRPLGLPARRPAAPHPRRHLQQGQDDRGRALAKPGRHRDVRGQRGDL